MTYSTETHVKTGEDNVTIVVIIVLDHITPIVFSVWTILPYLMEPVCAKSSGAVMPAIYGVVSAILFAMDATAELLMPTVFYVSKTLIAQWEDASVEAVGVVIAVPTGSTSALSNAIRLKIQFAMDGRQEIVPSV